MYLSDAPSFPCDRRPRNSPALRLDAHFTVLMEQASESVRRRVIAMFTVGAEDGTEAVEGDQASPGGHAAETSSPKAGDRGFGVAKVLQMQEAEIATLKHELSEAMSRVPRGVGGVSALEESLKHKVGGIHHSRHGSPSWTSSL